MYCLRLQFLARVFLDADNIFATRKNLVGLLNLLDDEDVEPVVSQQAVVGGGPPVSRLGFRSRKGDWLLALNAKAFDFVMGHQTPDRFCTFEEFCELASHKLSAALGFFGRRAGRLAAVQEGVLKDLELPKTAPGCFFKLPDVLQGPEPFEFHWNYAVPSEFTLAGRQEPSLSILSLAHSKGQTHHIDPRGSGLVAQSLNGLILSIDTNTQPSDMSERFGQDEVAAFFDEAAIRHASLEQAVSAQLESNQETS